MRGGETNGRGERRRGEGGVMERARTFQEMLEQGTFAATDALVATGVAMIVIGVLAIIAPLATGVIFDMFIGALFIGAGVVELVDAFRSSTWQRGALLALAGLVTLVAGALYIARPIVGLVILTVVFIGYLVFVGAFRLVLAFELPKGSPGKAMGFVSGVVALVLAYLAIGQLPGISAWLIGTFLGVSLVFAGAARLSLSRGFRRAASVLRPSPAQRGAPA
jgi:uncharacterized membrane protein HdeD (DUF308 family)